MQMLLRPILGLSRWASARMQRGWRKVWQRCWEIGELTICGLKSSECGEALLRSDGLRHLHSGVQLRRFCP